MGVIRVKQAGACAPLVALALLLGLVIAPSALAGPPSHSPLPSLDIGGFNHACGAAVDSEGDVYVSSAGESRVRIFDREHDELAFIENANEPCGLAVDSKGDLYVSERGSGNVVVYSPSEYPFVGVPTYGLPTIVDSSGKATGIAVDPSDDRLYVAEGDRIDVYEPGGVFEGSVGVGDLTEATGVAAYTYAGNGLLYVFAADTATDQVEIFSGKSVAALALRRTIDGSDEDAFKADMTPDNGIDLGAAGASLAVDRGHGHVLVYDAGHGVVDEFEAGGAYLTQISSAEFADAEPTAIAVYPDVDEIQRVQTSATGGSFTLAFEGAETGAIPYDAEASAVRAALEGLATIDAGEVFVQEVFAGGLPQRAYNVVFSGDLGDRDLPQLQCDATGLVGGSGTCVVTSEPPGSGPGRIYVTAGAGAGAKLLTFGPLAPPARAALPGPASFTLKSARSVAVDAFGNRYVGAGASIGVYPPDSEEPLLGIEDPGNPYDLAVDSECRVYALEKNSGFQNETAVYFTPASCPPKAGTKYSGPTTVATNEPPFFPEKKPLISMGLNPITGHLYVSQRITGQTIELDSAKKGSGIVDPEWGSSAGFGEAEEIDSYGANGDVYVSSNNGTRVLVLNAAGTEVLSEITGAGSPRGSFNPRTRIAVNQANGHLISFTNTRGVADEYEASGAFVSEFGSFNAESNAPYRVAIDSSCDLQSPPLKNAACEAFDPAYGDFYVAFDDPAPETFDLAAFGPLSYGEPPAVVTGTASGVGGGSAALSGTVDPRGFDLSGCAFGYLTDAEYEENLDNGDPAFQGAKEQPCSESLEAIGHGAVPVQVHAGLSGLDPEDRYRFRLVAESKFGIGEGAPGVFGPPVATTAPAQPISFHEATLRATIDPSGLVTEYHFEYLSNAEYLADGETFAAATSTPSLALSPTADSTEVAAPIADLAEGTAYRFRVVAENEAKAVNGSDRSLTTLQRSTALDCPNAEYRTGRSADLPDCRAYELVTPAETRGMTPGAVLGERQFNNWLVAPSGPTAGERLSFYTNGTLPGFDGNGILDGYRARRAPGAHPSEGWSSELFSPSYVEAALSLDTVFSQDGVAADQEYSLWHVQPLEGTLAAGRYLRTPSGFEPLGRGSLGTDLDALSNYVSPRGTHVIFGSKAHLETAAAPAPTQAVYDRSAGDAVSHVVSVKPDGSPFTAGEDATYVGATEDGTAIAFKAGGALYLRRGGASFEVAAAPSTFAGVSEDGQRVFYADANVVGQTPAPAGLWVCDTAAGSCAGPEKAHSPTEIAPNSRFVDVSADGSHVYFTSTDDIDGGGEGVAGKDNLYVWDEEGGAIHFVAILDSADLAAKGFIGGSDNLVRWTDAIGLEGRASSPVRSTPDGSVLVFQSYARLTPYDNTEATAGACGKDDQAGERCFEIYRYDAKAAAGEQLSCVSCDPTEEPPTSDSMLQDFRTSADARSTTVIPNVTADGGSVFFQSEDALLPEDANSAADVYEWHAPGTGGCERAAGCLALISSGQGEEDSFLYSMTPDGHDVFFGTLEKLVGADISGTPSIYDARVGGGVPDPPTTAPCQGDACQGGGAPPPVLPAPASTGAGGEGSESKPPRACPRGKHKVKRHGKAQCIRSSSGKSHKKHRHRGGRASR